MKKAEKARVSKAEQAAATRERLVTVARKHFARDGYEAAATEAIVAEAEVTRGALYHLFSDKRDLFKAVVIAAHREVLRAIDKAAKDAGVGIAGLVAGADAFLVASQRSDVLRPYLIDGPAVLGWEAWRALDADFGAGSLRNGLATLQREGDIDPQVDLDAMTHMINGMLNETALAMAQSSQTKKLRTHAIGLLRRILDSVQRGR